MSHEVPTGTLQKTTLFFCILILDDFSPLSWLFFVFFVCSSVEKEAEGLLPLSVSSAVEAQNENGHKTASRDGVRHNFPSERQHYRADDRRSGGV